MTRRDEVIRMALEAGLLRDALGLYPPTLPVRPEDMNLMFERFAALVAAAERERCAKACEDRGNRMRGAAGHPNGDRDEFYCADDIRALKDGVGG